MDRYEMAALLADCVDRGEISEEAAGAVLNAFDNYSPKGFLPETYAEVDYGDRDDAEAADGMRFDDMNYLRYRER